MSTENNTKEYYNLYTDIVGNCFIKSPESQFGMFTSLEREQVIHVIKELKKQHTENNKLKLENKMLKATIGRNEAHINRIKNNSQWDNTANHNEDIYVPSKRPMRFVG